MRPQIRADRLWESLIDGMRDESENTGTRRYFDYESVDF